MKKTCLTVVGIYLMFLHSYSQFISKDTSLYEPKPLSLDEINLVSSYYSQTGNHSPVTGGIGSEKVTDLANSLEVKLIGTDLRGRKNTLNFGLGLDHHTAASAAWVSKSGASKTGGTRFYPSVNWSLEDPKTGKTWGLGISYSGEYNYKSFGLEGDYSQKNNKGGEFKIGFKGYFDRLKLIYPSELRPVVTVITSASGSGGANTIPSDPRVTLTGSLAFTQIVNSRMQAGLFTDPSFQSGNLGLPFHRVYFTDGSEQVESLPNQRFKVPIGIRLHYFLGDRVIIRSYYRYYWDNWGISSHTANLEIPVKITPFVSLSPFYRYYIQTAAQYFAPYASHAPTDKFYTSNYALSAFSSQYFGAGIRWAPPHLLLNHTLANMEIRYGHYSQTTGLLSDVISLNLGFK